MSVTISRLVLSYGMAVAGVILAGLSQWWLAPLIGDTPPVWLLLVAVVTASAWLGGLGPGLFATAMGLVAIVAANDAPGDLGSLVTRLVRFGSLALLITLVFAGLHAHRRRAELREQQYLHSEGRYRRLVEAAGEGIWVIDRDGRTTYANPRLVEMLGVPPGRLIGLALEDFLVDPRDAPGSWSDPPNGPPAWHELRLRGGDGAVRDAIVTARPIGPDEVPGDGRRPEQGAPGGFLLMVTDVTPLKRAEQALREQEEDLRVAKELAEAASRAKDRFLAVLSHELRTPLTPVLIAVSSMLESKPDPALLPALGMIRRNIELEARLIDDLLDLSRIGRGRLRLDLEVVDIHHAIGRALEICRDEVLIAGMDVVADLKARHHHVTADYARVMQIVWNLVRNAAKFTPRGGRLTIRTTNPPGPPDRGERSNEGHDHHLTVEFEDTGIGIDPVILPRIFDAFEQGHDDLRGRSGGLGLGLAISRALAQEFGGGLTVSSPGHGLGSTFRLEMTTVPAPAPAPVLVPVVAPAPAPRASNLRILLVEDNEDTLRFLAIVLRQRGHEVVIADRYATARAAVDQAKAPFDLLLSDIELPDGSGLDLMRQLNARGGMPGIAMSGFGAEEDLQLSREAGFFDHLTKPIELDRLDAAIRHAVRRGGDPGEEFEPFSSRSDGSDSGVFRMLFTLEA